MNILFKIKQINKYILQKILQVYFYIKKEIKKENIIKKKNIIFIIERVFLTLLYLIAYCFFLGTLKENFPKPFKKIKILRKMTINPIVNMLTNPAIGSMYFLVVRFVVFFEKHSIYNFTLKNYISFVLRFNIIFLTLLEMLIYLSIVWYQFFTTTYVGLYLKPIEIGLYFKKIFLISNIIVYSSIVIYSYVCCLFNIYPKVLFVSESTLRWMDNRSNDFSKV
jgi:hypothetical protein